MMLGASLDTALVMRWQNLSGVLPHCIKQLCLATVKAMHGAALVCNGLGQNRPLLQNRPVALAL